MTITVSELFRQICPKFTGAAITATVTNGPTEQALWDMLEAEAETLRETYTTETLKMRSGISATRAAYKAAGKDPSRYRPACEQLVRRILQGKQLNSIDTLVDIGNLISIRSGYSTAVIDAGHLATTDITLDFGQKDEPYEGIGRGLLNIEHLPAYRDGIGAFATPTSDSRRTMTSPDTRKLLFIINGYDGNRFNVEKAVAHTQALLQRFAAAVIDQTIWY